METTSSRCPVPAEQIPIREYEAMRESWFYSWGTRHLRGYLTPVVVLWSLSWLFTGPVAAVSYGPAKLLPQFLASGAIGSLVIPTLALIQLYTGWQYVCDRLQKQAVPYEESGWYDGQVWIKPDEVLSRDRLIVDYQVKPILRRLQRTFGVLAGILSFSLVSWQFL